MRPLPKFDKRAAINEAAEAKTWWCSDCGLPTEEGETCCSNCLQYWADVANGMFDNYDEWQYEKEQQEIEDFNRERNFNQESELERDEMRERVMWHYDEIDDWCYVEHY